MSAWEDLGTRESSESTNNRIRLDDKIQTLCEIHGRKLSDEARAHWLRELMPYAAGKAIYKALDSACNEARMPSVSWVKEQMAILARSEVKPFTPPPEMTTAEKIRADEAAILSMLWLEYTKGFGPVHIGGVIAGCMSRIYARQFGKTEPEIEEALAAARAKYPREYVLRWMDEQKKQGN